MADSSSLLNQPGYLQSFELVDERSGRERVRFIKHTHGAEMHLYIEAEGNHDGVVVYTLVRVSRAKFAAAVKHIGGLL
jgi:hypothetical protein